MQERGHLKNLGIDGDSKEMNLSIIVLESVE
jgi:hypothetical protein